MLRSFHPTHPICAFGKRAKEILDGHELAAGPNGVGTPFDKLNHLEGKVLRIGTDANTPCHYVQELTGYPNQFLDERMRVSCLSSEGHQRDFELRVYRKLIPNLIWVRADSGEVCPVHPVNFLLLQPGRAQAAIESDPRQRPVLGRLLRQRMAFVDRGWLKATTLHGAIWESYQMKPVLEVMTEQFASEIGAHPERYDLARLEALLADGQYPIRRLPAER